MADHVRDREIEIVEWAKTYVFRPVSSRETTTLITIGNDPNDDRADMALWALGFAELPTRDRRRVLEALVSVLDDSSRSGDSRGEAASAIGEQFECIRCCPLRDLAISRLRSALSDPDAVVRFWAVFALGKLRSNEAIDQIRALLGDGEAPAGWWPIGREAADVLALLEPSSSKG